MASGEELGVLEFILKYDPLLVGFRQGLGCADCPDYPSNKEPELVSATVDLPERTVSIHQYVPWETQLRIGSESKRVVETGILIPDLGPVQPVRNAKSPPLLLLLILVHADDEELTLGKELCELPHGGESPNTRRTPGRPEVEKNEAPMQRVCGKVLSRVIGDAELCDPTLRAERKVS